MRIIGVDPGFGRTGWGVIEIVGKNRMEPVFVAGGCVETSPKQAFQERILEISKNLEKICKLYKPDAAALEKLFFAKNVRTAMQVGEARGIALLTFAHAGIIVNELTPNQVKLAVTGYGHADKTQIGRMVKIILKLKEVPKPDDAADALAIAIAASSQFSYERKKTIH